MSDLSAFEKTIPSDALSLINALEAAGYEAYIVGGPVRDILIGRIPCDYDITTSAEVGEVKRVFSDKKTVDTGILHGTVTVVVNGVPYEITTYREDGEYLDSRHPVSVSFTKSIEEDLKRRDFTVNAMAYSPTRGLLDLHGGCEDAARKIIRAVGNAERRFEEDALRILRALRFGATLDFEIEGKTAEALVAKRQLLLKISAERIFAELKKLLAGSASYRVISEFSSVFELILPELAPLKMPEEAGWADLSFEDRLAILFALNSNSVAVACAANRLKWDNSLRDRISKTVALISSLPADNDTSAREFLLSGEDSILLSALRIGRVMSLVTDSTVMRVKKLITEDMPRKVSHLAIKGSDISALGAKGEAIGEVLKLLLKGVCLGELENDRCALINEAKAHIKP